MSVRARSAQFKVAFTTRLKDSWLDQLVHASVETDVSLPALCSLGFRDPHHNLLADTHVKLGSPVSVWITTTEQANEVSLFTGEVTAVESEVDGTGTYTVIRAMDYTHRMNREPRVDSYREQSTSQIASKILKRSGLFLGSPFPPNTRYPHLSQLHQTDWELLRQLADLSGTEIHVDGRNVTLRKPSRADKAPAPGIAKAESPYVLEYGTNLLSLRTSVTAAGQFSDIEVRGWDPATKQAVVDKVSTERTDRYDIGSKPGDAARAYYGKAPIARTATGTISRQDNRDLAKSIAEDLTRHFVDMEATAFVTPRLKAGDAVTLTNTGRLFTGRYTTTAVRHFLDPDHGVLTWLRVGTPRASEWQEPGSAVPAPGHNMGLAIGIVDAVDEPTPKTGSVRLRLPWLDANYLTGWVRTVQLGGKGGGGVISPSVGDEVLVGFEHGRLDRPYVIGGLYNGLDGPGFHDSPLIGASNHVNRRSLASRSGDRIELLDEAVGGGKNGVRLITGPGLSPGLDSPEIFLDRSDDSITLSTNGTNGKKITIDRTGIEITHGGTSPRITMSDNSITLAVGSSEVTVTAEGITLGTAGGDLELNAAGTARIEAATRILLQSTSVDVNSPVIG
ncbi:VgrG-related protein [Streptomyces goshikiensis]